jgi:hypothetical protein
MAFEDIIHDGAFVESFNFDYYGMFFMTCAGGKIRIFYYRDYTHSLSEIESKVDLARFD